MKLLFDFLPIVLFFATYKYAESHKQWAADYATLHLGSLVAGGTVGAEQAPVLLATVVVIIATLAQVLWLKASRRKVDAMLWVSLALVVILGGATVYFQSDTFIKWKPTGLYWAMALALGLAPLAGKNLLKLLMGEQLQLPDRIWQRLNLAWVGFFVLMGVLNLWVAYSFSTDAWVNFKLFGSLGLTLVFTIAQGLALARYLDQQPPEANAPGEETR